MHYGNHPKAYISFEEDGYNPDLMRMTYQADELSKIEEIYLDKNGNFVGNVPDNVPAAVKRNIQDYKDYVFGQSQKDIEYKEKKPTLFYRIFSFVMSILFCMIFSPFTFAMYLISFAGFFMPVMTIVSHFTNIYLAIFVSIIYFVISIVFQDIFFYVTPVLTVIGAYFAFQDLPPWAGYYAIFFILWLIYFLFAVIVKIFKR